MSRWSKPATIIDCVEGDSLVQMPSGETMIQAFVSTDDETIERMFEGRICMNCLEPLEVPFPEVCNALKLPDGQVVGCYYRVRDRQLHDLSTKYGSLKEVRIGARVNKREELERLAELDAYEERTGVVLPASVKFPTQTFLNGEEVTKE